MNDILYTALVLDADSKNSLEDFMYDKLDELGIDSGEVNVYCHHMTIYFRAASSDEINDFVDKNEGEVFSLTPFKFGISNKAMAVQVKTNCPSDNVIKHVTLCTYNGGTPKESNNIINWQNIPEDKMITLRGKVQKFYKTRK